MDSLTVALVQHDIIWLDAEANLKRLEDTLDDLSPVDLILLSETFATGFAVDSQDVTNSAQYIVQWLVAQAKSRNVVMAASVLVEQQQKRFNRLYWVSPNGDIQYYDKRHLFCLGQEGQHIQAGEKRVLFELNGFRILPQICYDLRFPVFARNRNDYDVMINIANWPAARRDAWDTLLKARAIENQSYVLGVNRVGKDGHNIAHNGGTAAYRFDGKTLASAQDDHCETLVVTLHKANLDAYRQAFPAWQDSDPFTLDIGR
ncbi:amidohydrolase [Pseudoalteromonas sp. YIC-656]|uniref:amidohydrolase n=1 Tax=Pseudoalteromonas pernae TaxID=3118054 RepID=UPI0032423BDC